MAAQDNLNPQQFFHGTRHEFKPGDVAEPGHNDDYESPHTGEHVYLTSSRKGAADWADDAYGHGPARVYEVQPTGPIEPDPAGREDGDSGAHRSRHPLKILGEG